MREFSSRQLLPEQVSLLEDLSPPLALGDKCKILEFPSLLVSVAMVTGTCRKGVCLQAGAQQ